MKTFTIDDRDRIEKIIRGCAVCFVGMADENETPYVLPMSFGYDDGVIFLHSAAEGRSICILEKNPRVCITFCSQPELIRQHPDVACSYRMKAESVVCNGRVIFEDDLGKKKEALNRIMRQYTGKDFSYSAPAVNNVKVWKVKIESVSAKEFGVLNPGGESYNRYRGKTTE